MLSICVKAVSNMETKNQEKEKKLDKLYFCSPNGGSCLPAV